jgi:hypothetical protein
MMGASNLIISGTLAALGYVLAPIMLVWGWARWTQRSKPRTVPSILSLLGFVLASTSALLAVSAIAYAQIHAFPYYDPKLMKIMATGVLLSLAGFRRSDACLLGTGCVNGITTRDTYFISFSSRRPASSSVSGFLQNANRTCCAPSFACL